jgi:hypothetical protein
MKYKPTGKGKYQFFVRANNYLPLQMDSRFHGNDNLFFLKIINQG